MLTTSWNRSSNIGETPRSSLKPWVRASVSENRRGYLNLSRQKRAKSGGRPRFASNCCIFLNRPEFSSLVQVRTKLAECLLTDFLVPRFNRFLKRTTAGSNTRHPGQIYRSLGKGTSQTLLSTLNIRHRPTPNSSLTHFVPAANPLLTTWPGKFDYITNYPAGVNPHFDPVLRVSYDNRVATNVMKWTIKNLNTPSTRNPTTR